MLATLIEGFEVRTVYAGELGRGAYLGRPDARAPRLVADEAEVTAELAGATVVDGRDWAGAMDAVHELGLGLVRLVAAARAGAPRAVVRLAVGNDFLLQVAKLRALRALWARVAELGAAPELVVWVEPSAHGWTVYDPWVNLLRNTAGCFAAIVGGADWVGPRAFDAALGEPDAQARRLAENTFHLLVHEGHVASPGDPAAGSWAIEAWTSELAARAWGVMQDLERHGSAGGDDASVASIAASIGASARRPARRAYRQAP
ncbi:MAG: methylmalonyl-CoA mutase family protein [Myxococcota bacterium]